MSDRFYLGSDWHIQPLDGDTGCAYMGVKDGEKVFIKRNASPFLAALSVEGIAPKLVWTRRNNDGDIITAQEWLDGRILTPKEMAVRGDVISILKHIHESDSLSKMLYKVGGREVSAFTMLSEYTQDIPPGIVRNHYLSRVGRYLEDHLPGLSERGYTVCHGDCDHHNWLLSETEELYLVDWDSVRFADPFSDIGIIFGRYVPRSDWARWLQIYGAEPTRENFDRVLWYSAMAQLMRIRQTVVRGDMKGTNKEILLLKDFFAY